MTCTNYLMYKTCLPCYLRMEITLIPFQLLIWPVLSTNYFSMKSQLSYSPSTLEKVYSNPSDCVFGVKTATSQFQRVIDSILYGIKGVMVRVDDILMATSGRVTTHVGVIKQVLSRLAKRNVKLNGAKCQFFQAQVKYMGHMLSKQGISPVNSKLDAIRLAARPKDVSQLRSFLGTLNYYSKFIKDFSSKLHPLYQLLSNKTEWFRTKECETAFIWAKEVLSSKQVLVHYDPQKPLILSVDASPYRIGAVLSHRMEDGSEQPVEFASRTLSSAEKNYAQIEKERLAIVFGVKRFQLHLYGRKFTLVTDHQPLIRI